MALPVCCGRRRAVSKWTPSCWQTERSSVLDRMDKLDTGLHSIFIEARLLQQRRYVGALEWDIRTGVNFSAHCAWVSQINFNDLITVWTILSAFPSVCGWYALENRCLIFKSLHNWAINLFLNDDPWSDRSSLITPYRAIISLYRISATSSAVVLLVGKAFTYKVVLSTTIKIWRYPSIVWGNGPTKSMCTLPNGSTTSKGFSGASFDVVMS